MTYDLLLPRRIVFGWGRRREVGDWAATLGRRAWIVSGSRTLAAKGELDELAAHLEKHLDCDALFATAR